MATSCCQSNKFPKVDQPRSPGAVSTTTPRWWCWAGTPTAIRSGTGGCWISQLTIGLQAPALRAVQSPDQGQCGERDQLREGQLLALDPLLGPAGPQSPGHSLVRRGRRLPHPRHDRPGAGQAAGAGTTRAPGPLPSPRPFRLLCGVALRSSLALCRADCEWPRLQLTGLWLRFGSANRNSGPITHRMGSGPGRRWDQIDGHFS